MKSYLRNIIDSMIIGESCPVNDLKEIRLSVPQEIIVKHWNDVILGLFLEKGDTAYARDGYHHAVNLIEKHLLTK